LNTTSLFSLVLYLEKPFNNQLNLIENPQKFPHIGDVVEVLEPIIIRYHSLNGKIIPGDWKNGKFVIVAEAGTHFLLSSLYPTSEGFNLKDMTECGIEVLKSDFVSLVPTYSIQKRDYNEGNQFEKMKFLHRLPFDFMKKILEESIDCLSTYFGSTDTIGLSCAPLFQNGHLTGDFKPTLMFSFAQNCSDYYITFSVHSDGVFEDYVPLENHDFKWKTNPQTKQEYKLFQSPSQGAPNTIYTIYASEIVWNGIALSSNKGDTLKSTLIEYLEDSLTKYKGDI